jgi:plastocyanin
MTVAAIDTLGMKRRRFIGAALATASTPLVAGCGSGGGDGNDDGNGDANGDQTTTTVPGPENVVTASSSEFDPIRLSVDPGTEVTWMNEDAYTHTVDSAQFHDKAADWSMSERMTANGGESSHTFEEAGVYEYYCSVHGESEMAGAILVGDVSLDQSLPNEE